MNRYHIKVSNLYKIISVQISVKYSQDVIQVSEVLSPYMLDKVKTVVVQDLGFGISRGYMNCGRLFRGNYVPPERTDGISKDVSFEGVIQEETDGEALAEVMLD